MTARWSSLRLEGRRGSGTSVLPFTLEVPHHRILRVLNARTYSDRFQDDHVPDAEMEA